MEYPIMIQKERSTAKGLKQRLHSHSTCVKVFAFSVNADVVLLIVIFTM